MNDRVNGCRSDRQHAVSQSVRRDNEPVHFREGSTDACLAIYHKNDYATLAYMSQVEMSPLSSVSRGLPQRFDTAVQASQSQGIQYPQA
jgi:hypothetical protein